MPSTRAQLINKALLALEEVARSCADAPAPRSYGLRFILAFLFIETSARERDWFDMYWQAVTNDDTSFGAVGIGRSQSANAALNAIYRMARVQRTPEMIYLKSSSRTRP